MLKYQQIPCTTQLTNKFLLYRNNAYFCPPKNNRVLIIIAEVAHLVEHDLAKVGVAGSSPVFRSKINPDSSGFFFFTSYSGGGTGRHAGLKILFAVMRVTVQFRSRVQIKKRQEIVAFLFCESFNNYLYLYSTDPMILPSFE